MDDQNAPPAPMPPPAERPRPARTAIFGNTNEVDPPTPAVPPSAVADRVIGAPAPSLAAPVAPLGIPRPPAPSAVAPTAPASAPGPASANDGRAPRASATPEVAAAARRLEGALMEIKKVIVGQDRAIERMLVCLLARGHCLLEGVPGLAKTLAVETMATVAGGTFVRIQFTPDLLPADIVGTRIYRGSTEKFDIELGPVFANFVLADEINRAPAKVQSALLEVMAEHQVSIAGQTFEAPTPFLVLATQNPIEQEGVYPLPEAQRDRFLMKIVIGYPSPVEELEIVHRMGVDPPTASQVLDMDELASLQAAADSVYVDHGVVDYAVNVVLASRQPAQFGLPELTDLIAFGASPRASLGLVAGARALALLRGRSYALPQDVFDIAPDVLRHRIVPSYESLAQGLSVEQILTRILSTVPAPRLSPAQVEQRAGSAPTGAPGGFAPVPPAYQTAHQPAPGTPPFAPTAPPSGHAPLVPGGWARPDT